jgi:hypothetical protein
VDSLKESVSFLKTLLKEKSEVSACIQADYEVLQVNMYLCFIILNKRLIENCN